MLFEYYIGKENSTYIKNIKINIRV